MSTKTKYAVYYKCYICNARSPSPAHPALRRFVMCSDESMVRKKPVKEV